MSEKEKQQRFDYQQRRNRWIILQSAFITVLTAILLFTGLTHIKMNKDTYVSYKEQGEVIYKAYLSDNEFYDEEYLNGSHAYVSSLVERMTADFTYNLVMDTDSVWFKYYYSIDAQLEIRDKETQMAIFNPVEELVSQKGALVEDNNRVSITDSVELDYNMYNKAAKDFIAAYNLENTEANLIVRMYVDVLGKSEVFAQSNDSRYTIELFIPLNKVTITPHTETTVTEDEQKILAVSNSNKDIYKKLAISFGLLDLIAAMVLAVYIVATRDKHIDYARKVKRLVSSYKSYIQKINTEFDKANHQVLSVDSFTELLEIRDTLQIPILMFENEDKTYTEFFIITDSKIIYSYNIGVNEDFSQMQFFAKKGDDQAELELTVTSDDN